jgi:hypothetical protein
MSIWFKKLIEKFTKSQPEKSEARLSYNEYMLMTKKQLLTFCEMESIEVKDYWTKKNIVKEIIAKGK